MQGSYLTPGTYVRGSFSLATAEQRYDLLNTHRCLGLEVLVVGTTNFPTGPDDFSTATPTLQNTEDSTGRVHSERHDDMAAAMMAVQEYVLALPPASGAYVMSTWKFNSTGSAPPASGYIRTDGGSTPATATTLWMHDTDNADILRDTGLDGIVTGDQIWLRSPDFQANWVVVTNTDSGDYHTITVTLDKSLGTVPGNNAICQVYAVLAAFAQGASAPEIHVGPDEPTGDELVWYDTDENSIATTIIAGDTAPESHDVLWLDTTEEGPATTLAPFLLMGA
jgi:hypothetical protein